MKQPDPNKEPNVYKSFEALSPGTTEPARAKGSGRQDGKRAKEWGGQQQGPSLPEGYLSEGYLDGKGHLLEAVFLPWPEDITKALTDRRLKVKATKNSLRAFYSMLRMAKRQFDSQRSEKDADRDKALGDARTQLYKMRVGAVYQCERGVISPLCQEFLFDNIDTVLEHKGDFDDFAKNLNAFVEHFQAVIAYLPEKSDR